MLQVRNDFWGTSTKTTTILGRSVRELRLSSWRREARGPFWVRPMHLPMWETLAGLVNLDHC